MSKKVITEEVKEVEEVETVNAEEVAAAKAAKKLEAEAAKAAKKVEAAAAKEAAKAAKDSLRKNGELPPKPNSKCALVWDTATRLSTERSAAVDGASLQAELVEINVHTVKTQYARWRKYHGISGRIPKVVEVAEE